ncbi:MAG TPA: glycoside hydrolase family 3 N-terminal domain-containing protein [Terriglobales bacterium]|nr:glycoside hydrolase family 3 N-terminal domain-containing protein [Terriglobales bacterium]
MLQKTGVFIIIFVLLINTASAKDKYLKPQPVQLDRNGEKWAEKTLRKLSLEEKIGQLFMVRVEAEFLNVNSPEYQRLQETIRNYHVGSFLMTVRAEGPFLYKNEPYEAAELINRLQKESKWPLIVAADFERGLSMRFNGATEFPAAMAFGATGNTTYAEDFGRITAEEARAVGIEWNFFPDVDVNSNPANPIINVRSFGGDPAQVGAFAAAYIRGAKAGGMLTTAKHFPGHGDTATDSHLGLAQVTGNLARLQSVELPPFRDAIQAGVDAVMVAHLTVPALEPDPNRVATTSSKVIEGVLRQQLGFQGLVVTDALEMAGLTRLYAKNPGREAVDAFKAGNDLLLIPANLDACYQAMLQAIKSGEIPESRVDESVLKILTAKASVGLDKARFVDIDSVAQVVGKPENIARGRQIADDSITLVRDNGRVLPLKKYGTQPATVSYHKASGEVRGTAVVIFSDDMRTTAGREFEHQIAGRIPSANVFYVDGKVAAAISPEVLAAVDKSATVVVAADVAPVAGKAEMVNGVLQNSVALPEASGKLFRAILDRAAEHTAVVSLGNPYLIADFPKIRNYVCAFSNTNISQDSAVKALFGEIPIHGHLPVNIPGVAERGAGIEKIVTAGAISQ